MKNSKYAQTFAVLITKPIFALFYCSHFSICYASHYFLSKVGKGESSQNLAYRCSHSSCVHLIFLLHSFLTLEFTTCLKGLCLGNVNSPLNKATFKAIQVDSAASCGKQFQHHLLSCTHNRAPLSVPWIASLAKRLGNPGSQSGWQGKKLYSLFSPSGRKDSEPRQF